MDEPVDESVHMAVDEHGAPVLGMRSVGVAPAPKRTFTREQPPALVQRAVRVRPRGRQSARDRRPRTRQALGSKGIPDGLELARVELKRASLILMVAEPKSAFMSLSRKPAG